MLPRKIAISPESKNVPWNTAIDNNVLIPDNRPETQPLIIDEGPEEFKPEVRPEFRPQPKRITLVVQFCKYIQPALTQ